MKRSVIVIMKILITLWGIVSVFLGAARAFGINPDAPYSHRADAFVFLSYYSVLVIGMFGLIRSRIVSVLLGLSALIAVTILVLTQPTATRLGLGMSFVSALGVVVRGPVLVGLILFLISRSERVQRSREPA
jgi:hypothetical protein